MTARDLINTDVSKMCELEFRTTIIRIIAGVEKKSLEESREPLSVEIKEINLVRLKLKMP